ncbi:MAG TPA: PIN domain-containing protein [Gaiella sp.]
MYCLDTDVVAAALLRDPPLALVRRLARTPPDEQCTTTVTLSEIAYAAARNGEPELLTQARELLGAAGLILPFDADAAETYGALRARLDSMGIRLDEPSLRIAAIAVGRDLTLVTGSGRLYTRVPGLRIENWLEPDEHDLADDASGEVDATPDAERPATIGPGTSAGDGAVRLPGLLPGHGATPAE